MIVKWSLAPADVSVSSLAIIPKKHPVWTPSVESWLEDVRTKFISVVVPTSHVIRSVPGTVMLTCPSRVFVFKLASVISTAPSLSPSSVSPSVFLTKIISRLAPVCSVSITVILFNKQDSPSLTGSGSLVY